MKNLKSLITRNTTQREVSKKLNLSPQTLSNYLNNKTDPPIKTLIEMANYFNVSLDYLCDRQWNNQIGYIPDNKKEVIQLVLQLNEINTVKLFGYASGLLAGQN